ncbi:MAG: hypothetical protein IJF92_03395 [Bacilli bacterium]|nr:hypothetical protein [Bacilli bacterium]
MKKEDRLYIGNIMENWSLDNAKDKLVLKKESALLYKTKTGSYIDMDDVKESKGFETTKLKAANKLDIKGNNKVLADNIIIMPGKDISQVQNNDESGFLGIFVDEASLIPYTELKEREKESKRMF